MDTTLSVCVFRRFVTVSDATKRIECRKYSLFFTVNSEEQSPTWGSNRFSASQEIHCFLCKLKVITTFTSTRHQSVFTSVRMDAYHQAYYDSVNLSPLLVPVAARSKAAAAGLLRFWVRIPCGAWISVCCKCWCCQVEVSTTSWSHVQRGVLPTVARRCVWSVVLTRHPGFLHSWIKGN